MDPGNLAHLIFIAGLAFNCCTSASSVLSAAIVTAAMRGKEVAEILCDRALAETLSSLLTNLLFVIN